MLQHPYLSPSHAKFESLPRCVMLVAAEVDPNIKDMTNFMERMREKEQEDKSFTFIGRVYEKMFHGWNFLPEWMLGKKGTEMKWDSYQLVIKELKRLLNH